MTPLADRSLFRKIFLNFNIYSIDVVIGSIMMGIFASKVLQVHPPFWWYIILALAVWVFYTADHLTDALKSEGDSTILRHIAHYVNHRRILPMWIAAALVSGIMALCKLDKEIIYSGMILVFLILIYFSILFFNKKRHPWLLQKELIIAIVYVSGIWMAPIIWHGTNLPKEVLALMINMILLTWAEGVLISRFEYDADMLNNHVSFTTLFGKKAVNIFVIVLFILITGAVLYFLVFKHLEKMIQFAFAIQLLMTLLLLTLRLFPDHLRKNYLYRYLGEITFWLPGLMLLV